MPDTAGYFHAAYVATAVLYAGYVFSLWRRGRRARRHTPDGAAGQ